MQGKDTGPVELSSISIDVRHAPIDKSIIRIEGGLLDAATVPVWHTVEMEFLRSPELVAFDLAGVNDIDAAGIDVLVAAASRAGESDISFCLIGAYEGAVGTALAEADLTELFEIFPAGTVP